MSSLMVREKKVPQVVVECEMPSGSVVVSVVMAGVLSWWFRRQPS